MLQSMSEAGNCYDNAFMESCFGTLKTELELTEYADSVEAVRELSTYLHYYNQDLRHSSLGYLTPAEFETHWTSPEFVGAVYGLLRLGGVFVLRAVV